MGILGCLIEIGNWTNTATYATEVVEDINKATVFPYTYPHADRLAYQAALKVAMKGVIKIGAKEKVTQNSDAHFR